MSMIRATKDIVTVSNYAIESSKIILFFVLAIILVTLTACSPQIISKKEYVHVPLSEALFTKVPAAQPPSKEAYKGPPLTEGLPESEHLKERIKLLENRNELLRVHAFQLYGNIDALNSRLDAIRRAERLISERIEKLNKENK